MIHPPSGQRLAPVAKAGTPRPRPLASRPSGTIRGAARAAVARVAVVAVLLSLAACAPPSDPGSAPFVASSGPTRWHAVLVAADPSLPVWDNAVERFARSLPATASLRRFSAAGRPGAEPATLPAVVQAIAELRPGPGEGCLMFVTAHGVPDRGLVFAAQRQAMGPRLLDAALDRGCRDAPTVAILSGCFSGNFAPALARPNRAVLTAARADRPSFGCGAGYTYTVFDSCLLDALDVIAPRGWTAVADTTAACVSAEEARLRERPSEPQRAIAPSLANAPVRWTPAAGPAPTPHPAPGVKG